MIENAILSSLVFNDDFSRKVLPSIKSEYFQSNGEKVVFKLIKDHSLLYKTPPTVESLKIDLDHSDLVAKVFEDATKTIEKLANNPYDYQWLVDNTEEFCQRMSFYNAITFAASLLDAKEGPSGYGKALEAVQNAMGVSFDNAIGHDYTEDFEERYDYMTREESKLPCNLKTFNKVLRGGFVEKSMTVFLLPTGVGKSMMLCHFAASFLQQGLNVLYVTLEMPEKQVGHRIDANLLDLSMEDFKELEKTNYIRKIMKMKQASHGRLFIKEYPPHSIHAGHVRHLINELKLKKKFKPDVIMIDYLGIFESATAPKTANSYEKLKTASAEIRGLGMEFDCRTFTAMQVNKEGTKNIDFDITDTAESWGVPHNADYMYGGVSTEDLEQSGKMKIKRLKDRHNDKSKPFAFMIGIDRDKMRLFDCEQDDSDPENNMDSVDEDRPVFDNGSFASMMS